MITPEMYCDVETHTQRQTRRQYMMMAGQSQDKGEPEGKKEMDKACPKQLGLETRFNPAPP